jgi:hypothetical protein
MRMVKMAFADFLFCWSTYKKFSLLPMVESKIQMTTTEEIRKIASLAHQMKKESQ